MQYIDINEQQIPLDDEGYLLNLDDWSEALAHRLAEQDGVTLTDAHWEILKVVRAFYQTYDLSPAMRPLVKAVRQSLGEDKGKSIYLMKLFSESPAKQSARYAGLPKPANCL
jgi:tRNA 2-thiouridine synthesizing protein E